ncbi:ATP-binding cassette domain-containing protein [Ensifer canadensis]
MNLQVKPRSGPEAASGDAGGGIRVSGATVTYRNGHRALLDASFEIPTGTITALVGVNGSGKSTLFKAIMGFARLARGRNLHSRPFGPGGAEEEPCRLCAASRGGRLEFSGSGRGRGDDGPLRPHEHAAHPEEGRP